MDATEKPIDALTRLLEGDIRVLFDLTFTHRKPVPEANIRAAASILRRWLVDGDLQKIGNVFRCPITMTVFDTAPIIEAISKNGDIDFFLTAGVRMGGVPVQGIYYSKLEPHQVESRRCLPMSMISLPIKKVLAQRRHYFMGKWFTLEEEIRYVANKLGGNHYDTERDGFYEALDESSRFMRYGGPEQAQPGSELYLILEPTSSEVIGGVHLEIVAAAASFIQMEIDGQPVVNLRTKRPHILNLRRWLRRRANFKMIDFAEQIAES